MNKSERILFFFNHPAAGDERKINAGELPSDRLYGMVELKKRGWNIEPCDERLSPLEFRLKSWMSWISWRCIKKARHYDVWVVKDKFSIILSILAMVLGKRIVYVDSLFYFPKSRLRRWVLWINLKFAPIVGVYSKMQADFWASKLGVRRDKFRVLSYTVDHEFYLGGYQRAADVAPAERYVLATGRDMGRDFYTLIEATKALGLQLKLVTLPYLLPADMSRFPHVEVLQHISYEQLFSLYRGAFAVAIPLRENIEYPSGIRAALESMLLAKPTICSESDILYEYSHPAEGELLYVAPKSIESMSNALASLLAMTDEERLAMGQRAQQKVLQKYSMQSFVLELEAIFAEFQ